jgi:hypothetical protein
MPAEELSQVAPPMPSDGLSQTEPPMPSDELSQAEQTAVQADEELTYDIENDARLYMTPKGVQESQNPADETDKTIPPLTPVSHCKVTYDGNGNTAGVVPIDSNPYAPGSPVAVGDNGNLVKDGYSFLGWSTEADADLSEVEYDAGDKFDIGSDVVLYAVWQKNEIPPTVIVEPRYSLGIGGSSPFA